jgi:virulence-associated protein VapD
MTRDDIIRMAREAGFAIQGDMYGEDNEIARVERFAKLVEAAEREACAKMCEAIEDDEFYWGRQYADAIRARGAP